MDLVNLLYGTMGEICDDLGAILRIVGIVVKGIQIGVPIVLIFIGMMDFAKAVTEKDDDAHADDHVWNLTAPASFTRLIMACDGTKDDFIREWNNYCSYEKKDMIEDILRNYRSVQSQILS